MIEIWYVGCKIKGFRCFEIKLKKGNNLKITFLIKFEECLIFFFSIFIVELLNYIFVLHYITTVSCFYYEVGYVFKPCLIA